MKILLRISPLFFCVLGAFAQNVKLTYVESDENFANPERGFYIPLGTKASHFVLLDEAKLKTFRSQPQLLNGATYPVKVSLIYRSYELDLFKDKPLSASFLQKLQQDFDAVRNSGLKLILRFAYTNTSHGGDCKDQYGICPPYGDAPVQIVLQHIAQLKPLFHKNADVIAVLQQGFIGIWGENYFTDYFGSLTNDGAGIATDSNWQQRNKVLKKLLWALPPDRMVQVRTPQIKQRYVYGVRSSSGEEPMEPKEAFTKSDQARIGFHNDCFLSGPDDYGTFYDYGSSASKRDTANYSLRKYFEADSRYVAVGGETCDDTYSPENDCEPAGHAEKEMRSMHYSYLNASYNNSVNNDWESMGCMRSIEQKLGYRFVLKNATFPKKVKRGANLTVQFEIENKGYASPFNARPVQLILRDSTTGKSIAFEFNTRIQKWFTGSIVLSQHFEIPASFERGKYELLINLPDPYKNLQKNPAYSIRLANKDLWEEATGYNSLGHSIRVE